jgi:hypothetical protein
VHAEAQQMPPMQLPLAQPALAVQAAPLGPHCPAAQTMPAAQGFVHPPQWFTSVFGSTQPAPGQNVNVMSEHWQAPPTHLLAPTHALPQAPQLLSSS